MNSHIIAKNKVWNGYIYSLVVKIISILWTFKLYNYLHELSPPNTIMERIFSYIRKFSAVMIKEIYKFTQSLESFTFSKIFIWTAYNLVSMVLKISISERYLFTQNVHMCKSSCCIIIIIFLTINNKDYDSNNFNACL